MEKFIRAAQEYWRDNKLWGINGFSLRLEKYQGLLRPYNKARFNARDSESNRHGEEQKGGTHPYSNIPLDIAIVIAKWICPINYTPADVRNIRNMLVAWQWELPDGFWKRRLKEEDILFELESLREANYSIDWQSLRLDLMALVSDRNWYVFSGLANRVRVLSFMTAIASNSLDMSS
ncbi:hypothetical protein N7463_008685 [Penicillium fimorum]|uniref:Uncharacterized protein n=1 Tax=Penicillium fimorum TaxID=1882269 RepID=A0A9W9XPC0_9EURO|nr:hypothetical protein N7463_008685 [Penicillium fimorum]